MRSIYKKPKLLFQIMITIFLIIIISTLFWGLGKEKTLIQISLYSVTFIDLCMLIYLFIGLYSGEDFDESDEHSPDNMNTVPWKIPNKWKGNNSSIPIDTFFGSADFSDGIEGCLVQILLWIVISIVIFVAIYFLGDILIAAYIIFSNALYWIFWRASRIVFAYGSITRGSILKSLGIATACTALYSSWIFGIIGLIYYIK
jgi:hypothetical protein